VQNSDMARDHSSSCCTSKNRRTVKSLQHVGPVPDTGYKQHDSGHAALVCNCYGRCEPNRKSRVTAICVLHAISSCWQADVRSVFGPIPWGQSGPLCHALSLLSSSSWTSMLRRRALVATPDEYQCKTARSGEWAQHFSNASCVTFGPETPEFTLSTIGRVSYIIIYLCYFCFR